MVEQTVNNQATAVLEEIIGSASQKISWVHNRFQNCIQALTPRRDRLFSNLEKYAGYQLSTEQIAKLDKQKRIPIVMNLSTRKVQSLAAAIVKNIWDVSFSPIDGKRNSLMFALEDMMEVDKSYCGWDYNFLMHVIYALVQDSCMEMTLNTDVDPLGRIAWEVCQPGTIAYDPNWRTGISKDMDFCFKYIQLTARQILSIYPDSTDNLLHAIMADEGQGGNFDIPKINQYQDYYFSKTLNGLYNVIEYNYLVDEESVKEIDVSSGLELPQTDDVDFKKEFVQVNQINPENIRSIYCMVKKAKIITICPGILPATTLYDGYDIFQIERLRFFPMAAERIVGEPRGIMDIVAPIQDAVNKLINNTQHIIDTASHGGGGVDPAIVGGDANKMKEIQKHWADPEYKFWTQQNALKNGVNFFASFPTHEVNGSIFTHLNNLLNELNRDMLPINPASEGSSERSGEPGIVFNLKMQAIEQAQLVLMKNIESFLREIGEAYLDAARTLYSKVKRVFYTTKNEEVVINEVKVLPSGDVAIENDIGSLQKCRVVVALSPKSPNARFTQRMTQMDVLKLLGNDPATQELRAIHLAKTLETIDYDDEEEKIVADAVGRMLKLAQINMEKQLNPQPPMEKVREPNISMPFKDLPPEGKAAAMKKAKLEIEQQAQQAAPQENVSARNMQELKNKLQPLQAAQQNNQQGVQHG